MRLCLPICRNLNGRALSPGPSPACGRGEKTASSRLLYLIFRYYLTCHPLSRR